MNHHLKSVGLLNQTMLTRYCTYVEIVKNKLSCKLIYFKGLHIGKKLQELKVTSTLNRIVVTSFVYFNFSKTKYINYPLYTTNSNK